MSTRPCLAVVCVLAVSLSPVFAQETGATRFRRGDANADGQVDLSDAVRVLRTLFAGAPALDCADAGDFDDDGTHGIADAIASLDALFRDGAPPADPGVSCGVDPTGDALDCREYPHCAPGLVVISEFLADNETGLVDGFGARPDWIELENTSPGPVDLAGYYLTDRAGELTRWRFPLDMDLVLDAGERMLVFASGAGDDAFIDPRGFLHASFEISADGEFLALVEPDGVTVSSSYGPRFPQQRADVSYGMVEREGAIVSLLRQGSDARALVLTAPPPANWASSGFDAAAWSEVELGVGYETEERGVFTGKFESDLRTRMHGVTPGALLRVLFDVEAPASVDELTLWMSFDGGFIAYLNGVEIARANVPGGADPGDPAEAPPDAVAPFERDDLDVVTGFEAFELPGTELLVEGRNVLAIRGFNESPSSPRFLLLPTLEARVTGLVEAYFPRPTPGAANSAAAVDAVSDRVRDTEFSVDRGYFNESFDLAITSSTPGAAIRYTLNGSAPGRTRGTVYTGPLRIETTTLVRAIAYRGDHLDTDVDTQTYLFLRGPGGVLEQPFLPAGLPSVWAGYPADYGMDPEIVEHPAYRDGIEDDLKSLPALSIVMETSHMFGSAGLYLNPQSRGLSSERPASVELFSTDPDDVEFQVDAGIRNHGGAGRRPEHPKHAFRLLFRKRYGPGRLREDLYENQPLGSGEAGSYDKLIVRAGFNNTFPHWYNEQALRAQYVRDQWTRDLHFLAGHTSSRGRYVHLYLNGLYWGLYNLGERPDEDFGASYFGGTENDYDIIKNGAATAGDAGMWNRLNSLARSTSQAAFEEARRHCDFVDLVDYMLQNFYYGNLDWDRNNSVAIRRRNPPGPFHFLIWDAEFAISLGTGAQQNAWPPILSVNRTGVNNTNAPSGIFQGLRKFDDFAMLVADRIQKHFFNGGLLTPERVTEAWLARSDQVERAIVGESARWGDYRRDVRSDREPSSAYPLLTRDGHWMAHRQWILEEYFPRRTAIVIQQLGNRGMIPSLPAPELDRHGGEVERGFELSITTERGALLYTTDGSDPRLPGGAISPDAIETTGAASVTLARSTLVRARARDGGEWSALVEALFVVDDGLRVGEIMYHPLAPRPEEFAEGFDDQDDFEFIEIVNAGEQFIALEGLRFTEGIDFTFVSGAPELAPGERAVLVSNAAAFSARYGVSPELGVVGEYTGRLANGGEVVALEDGFGTELTRFRYSDSWYPLTDGAGYSLRRFDLDGDPNEALSWGRSPDLLGSPGGD